MNLILFFFIATIFTLTLGEFGQFPFGNTDFSVSIMDILLTISLCALLIWNIGIKKNTKLPKNFIYLIVFWAIGILSLFLSLDLSGWLYLVRFIIYSSTFYLTYHLVRSRILGLDEFLTLIKVTTVTLGVLGLAQLIIYPDLSVLGAYGYDPHKSRVFSTFLDPNFLGAFLNFGLITISYELLNKKFYNFKNLWDENKWSLISALILSTAILLTFSRSAYLMTFISLSIILVAKNLKLLGIFAVFMLLLYLVFPAFSQRINGALNFDDSASERVSSWEKGLIIFQQNPGLGVGFNNIRPYSQKLELVKLFSSDGGNSGAGVDSSLIFVLATTGLIGFLAYLLFFVRNLADMFNTLTFNIKESYVLKLQPLKILNSGLKIPGLGKWYRETNASPLKPNPLTLPLFALTLGLVANSFFINSLFFPPIMIIWFSFLGVFLGSQPEARTASSAEDL